MQQPDGNHANEKQHTNPGPSSTTPSTAAPRKQGIISNLPAPWIPYAELMRLDRPAGFYAFYIPYLIGLGYGACLADPTPSPTRLSTLGGIFFIGCIILRGAACAWNDNVDQEFDRKVTRCQNRPIARGAISTTQGHIFTAALTLAGAPLFLLLPVECSYHAVPITILFGAYALMKRITNYPQVVLGFPFAWGILMSCAALEIHPLGEQFRVPTLSLFVANILWTMIYDTIYAHQDLKDDVKAGVKSMAVRFADSTKTLASVLAVSQIGQLIVVGWHADFSIIYFLGTCWGSAIALGSMIARVDLKEPASCAWFFHRGFWYVGGSIVMGLFGEYLARLQGLEVPHVRAFI